MGITASPGSRSLLLLPPYLWGIWGIVRDAHPLLALISRLLLSAKLRSCMQGIHSFLSMNGLLPMASNEERSGDVRMSVSGIIQYLAMRTWHFFFQYECATAGASFWARRLEAGHTNPKSIHPISPGADKVRYVQIHPASKVTLLTPLPVYLTKSEAIWRATPAKGSLEQPFRTNLSVFCDKVITDLDDTFFYKIHRLFIPDQGLQAKIETLLSDIYLVIFSYPEYL